MKRNEIIAIIVALVLLTVLLSTAILMQAINTAQAIDITISFVLLLVTFIYVKRTAEIADATKQQAIASVKMAEAIHKPLIILESKDGTRGKYFMKEINIGIGNEGQGVAINVELYIAHPLFKFDRFSYPHSISVKQEPISHKFNVKEPSVDDDPKVKVEPVALVVANYEDAAGNKWHSTLELTWNVSSRDMTVGRMQVALSGHFEGGVKND